MVSPELTEPNLILSENVFSFFPSSLHRERRTSYGQTPSQISILRMEQEKTAAVQNSMLYEIVYTFGVPQHDPHDYCQWEMINFSRMGHARVLYAFLETKQEKRYMDDVLAVDYGYQAQTVKLPDEGERFIYSISRTDDYGTLRKARNRLTALSAICWTRSWLHEVY